MTSTPLSRVATTIPAPVSPADHTSGERTLTWLVEAVAAGVSVTASSTTEATSGRAATWATTSAVAVSTMLLEIHRLWRTWAFPWAVATARDRISGAWSVSAACRNRSTTARSRALRVPRIVLRSAPSLRVTTTVLVVWARPAVTADAADPGAVEARTTGQATARATAAPTSRRERILIAGSPLAPAARAARTPAARAPRTLAPRR